MTDYLTTLLGHVARHGIAAQDATELVVHHTMDEFAIYISQKTGMDVQYLDTLKPYVLSQVMRGRCTAPTPCQGRTKFGRPCKRMTYTQYCEHHQDQHSTQGTIDQGEKQPPSPLAKGIIRPMRFPF